MRKLFTILFILLITNTFAQQKFALVSKNCLFTSHLLTQLRTPGISVRDIFDRTGAVVSQASNRQQIPAIYSQYFGNAYLGSPPVANTPEQPAPTPAANIPVQHSPSPSNDRESVAAIYIIRNETINVTQLRTEVMRIEKSQGRSLNQQERLQVLNIMVNGRLALQAAERDGITVSDNEVNQEINRIKQQFAQSIGRQPTDAEVTYLIREGTGLDMSEYRNQVRQQLTIHKYLMHKKGSSINNIRTPTNQEILNTYNQTKSQFKRPDTVRASVIHVPYGTDTASKNRARETANRLAREIGSSSSKFDEVALRGQVPNSGYQAGDSGYFPKNMDANIVGQEFINIAFSLRQGEVSRVIEGRLGFQIIKITEIYPQKNLGLDDIFQLGTRITVRDYISQSILNERQIAALKTATEELEAELRAGGRTFQINDRNLNW